MVENNLSETHPEIAAQWNYQKNKDIKPEDVTGKSEKKVWWHYPYEDLVTGKFFDFEWQSVISSRTMRGGGCPYLSGHAVWAGYNDLASRYPEIAAEWNYEKNEDLKPENMLFRTTKNVWWYLPYNDPITGKHFDFEWKSSVRERTERGCGCPYLSGHAVWTGYNDLASRYPEIAAEWNYEKNKDLKPEDVLWSSPKKVWWYLLYDDPITGKYYEFEWQSTIVSRTKQGCGCPYLSGQAVWTGYNDLASRYPEIAAEWNYKRNKGLKPENIAPYTTRKVWWYLPYDDPITGKHYEFEWQSTIVSRTKQGCGCPYLSGKAVWVGYNDLASQFPEIAEQWNYKKNGSLRPQDVTSKSAKKVYWYLPYDDSVTGMHYEFEWQSAIKKRTIEGCECPYLSGADVWTGFNDLASRFPEIAKEWNYKKNGSLKPENIAAYSGRKVWWYLPYDDPITGKHYEFEWESVIGSRTKGGSGCPYLSGNAVWRGYNDLASQYPKIAAEWNYKRNKNLDPTNIGATSPRKVWWYLPYNDPITGKHYEFEWESTIVSRTKQGCECPYLSGKAVWVGYNDLASQFPEIAAQWDYKKNGSIRPQDVTAKSNKRVWWVLPYTDPVTKEYFLFEWESTIRGRTVDRCGCPYIVGQAVWIGFNDLKSKHPKIAAQWHIQKNKGITPEKIHERSTKKVWWRCLECGHEWRTSVYIRTKIGSSCPRCDKNVYF